MTTTPFNFLNQLTDAQLLFIVVLLTLIILTPILVLVIVLSQKRLKVRHETAVATHHMERQSLSKQLADKEIELEKKNELIDKLHHAYSEQKEQVGHLSGLLQQERKHTAEKLLLHDEAKKELTHQFQSLAHQIFDEKNLAFSVQSKEKLHSILSPFQEQLHSFKRRIDDIYHQEAKERVSLKQEITHLRDLNHQINREAINLTNALKGDKKTQGNWGEMVLERVLERSGLRKGHEYETQGGFRSHNNQLLKPDVVVHLPDGKDIIIDSKVSLVAWEKYVNSQDNDNRQTHLATHLTAIKDHVIKLGRKDYTNMKGVRTLDFILMFMPIEAAFVKAFQDDEHLFSLAYTNKIIIVSPTTLLATLRSIENIWRLDHQHRNSEEIAHRAGAIHDKLCSFVEDMERLGKQIETVNVTYEGAMTKLSSGRGNLVAQAHRFSELGVKSKKELPNSVKQSADLDSGIND